MEGRRCRGGEPSDGGHGLPTKRVDEMNLTLEIDDTVNAGYVYFRPARRPVDHTNELDDRREPFSPGGVAFRCPARAARSPLC
jgi:hypothetical protein